MEQLKAIEFLEENKEFLFPNKKYTEEEMEEALISAPDEMEMSVRSITFRNPTTVQLISFFVGSIGVDRFYFKEILLGILKYFSFGGLGIWWIIDIFSAKNRCRAYNCKKILEAINDPLAAAKTQKANEKIGNTVNKAKKYAPVAKEIAKGANDVRDTFFHN